MIPCLNCAAQVLRLDLDAHVNDVCNKAVVKCQGSVVGCTHTVERADMAEHEKTCPMATMAPHFLSMQARAERSEARFEPLVRKVGILEESLSNLTSLVYSTITTDSSIPANSPLGPNRHSDAFAPASLAPTPDFRLPPASFPQIGRAHV